jgi:hypothetical protein
MADKSLRSQSLDDLVANVQGLATVGSAQEVRSIMAVVARCTIDISEQAKQLAVDVNHAKTVLGERLNELTAQIRVAGDQMSADINTAKQAFLPAVAELVGDLKRTRVSIAEAGSAATKGTNALVRWTKALVIVTIVYAIFMGGLFAVSFMQLRAAASWGTPAQSRLPAKPPAPRTGR